MGSRLEANSSAMRKRIENHTFDNEDGEEYEASTFGGYGDYMRRKKLKLQNLDHEIRSLSPNVPPIFRGIVAHVNGYTQPSLSDLHHLIVSHGGSFLQYLDNKTNATHIIASALTPKKREEFRKYRIVNPAWVVESIKAGRLLPWHAFRVVEEGPSRRTLKFDGGHLVSQSNTRPQQGYKQSDSSWYTPQFKNPERDVKAKSSPPQSPSASQVGLLPSNSCLSRETDYGEFPTLSSWAQTNGSQDENQGDLFAKDTSNPDTIGTSVIENSPSPSLPLIRETIPANLEMTPEEYNAQLLSDPRMKNLSVVNPEFLQQYYRESRLHHLSTWKAELKTKLQAATQEKLKSSSLGKKWVPGARRFILHVDYDCFFAAVSIHKHNPILADKPVAVAHGTGSSSEIACCNYPARTFGVRNGMWMKGALDMCPELKVLPYDFPAYEEASRQFYNAILSIDGIVQSVSIDEALIDITAQCHDAGGSNGNGISESSLYREQAKADEVARKLRDSIREKTGCAVSVGIGGNILQAKVALRKAKPAGQFQLKPENVLDFIAGLSVQDLPGVAYSLGGKLEELGIKLVKDLRELPREKLTSSLGPKTGAKLWDYARGIDRTEVGVQAARKSVSAEINWGIRFVTQAEAEAFMQSLSDELHRRLVENLVEGTQLSIRILRRSADAPLEPAKHLGHGKCDVFNKSVNLGVATNARDIIGKEAISMLQSFGFSPGDLRGLGLQMTKLESIDSAYGRRLKHNQQQLNFKLSPTHQRPLQNLDSDELESPQRGGDSALTVLESIGSRPSLNDAAHKPLNILGTQFIMPSQADPKVVAELPVDIRSCLVPKSQHDKHNRTMSPSSSPTPLPNLRTFSTNLPPQSQLDPEILNALPEDVCAEILSYYDHPSATNNSKQPLLPSLPLASSRPSKIRNTPTVTTKRRGRPPGKVIQNTNATLTQSNFILARPGTAGSVSATSSRPASPPAGDGDDIPGDFLDALPEDIRREVLEQHKSSRLHHHSGLGLPPSRKPMQPKSTAAVPAGQKLLRLPPMPRRPVFTANRLSTLPELRRALSAWYSTFRMDGPFVEDVTALAKYLTRVILEEKDIGKAVSITNWLSWLITDSGNTDAKDEVPRSQDTGSDSSVTWNNALKMVQNSVRSAVEQRGLPPVEFS